MHPERRRRTAELERLAEGGEQERLYQLLMLREFPHEARMGWQLAFLRTFAVPRMAELLLDTGQLVDQPRKRAYDTGLIIYEIVHGGFESPRARRMVAVINRAHHGYPIEAEDLTYVLCAFIVTPIRHLDRVGWRRTSGAEKQAAVTFFAHLGRLMNIATIPADWAEATGFYDDYEARMVRPSRDARQLTGHLVTTFATMQPRPLRPVAAVIFTLLLDDRRVTSALGLPTIPRPLRPVVERLIRLRAAQTSRSAPTTKGVFEPGTAVGGVYPHGYDLGDLGPG